MKCDKHPEKDAVAVCISCGKRICQECDFTYDNKHYCEDCKDNPVKEKEIQISAQKKSLQSKINIITLICVIWGVITGSFTLGFLLILAFYFSTTSSYNGSAGLGILILIGVFWLIFVSILILIILKIKKMTKEKNLIK